MGILLLMPATTNIAENNKKDPVLSQLNRVHGQLGGVIKMYEDDRPCIEIVRQILATRNSLGRTAREFLTKEAGRCTREQNHEELEEILIELFK